ncbi:hypothetical protein RIF29_28636 [Crotalaria pallida]|uniref:Uncharacterized protein n=1 Tax=Crotalaria pallida TaxID=3830 RepID=A0AAN9EF67_CROPI
MKRLAMFNCVILTPTVRLHLHLSLVQPRDVAVGLQDATTTDAVTDCIMEMIMKRQAISHLIWFISPLSDLVPNIPSNENIMMKHKIGTVCE